MQRGTGFNFDRTLRPPCNISSTERDGRTDGRTGAVTETDRERRRRVPGLRFLLVDGRFCSRLPEISTDSGKQLSNQVLRNIDHIRNARNCESPSPVWGVEEGEEPGEGGLEEEGCRKRYVWLFRYTACSSPGCVQLQY